MLPRILLTLCALAAVRSGALAAAGDYLGSIPYAAADLLSVPSLNRIYVSAPGTHSVIWAYDNENLRVMGGIPIPNQPGLMALSPDGSEVYYVTTVAGIDYINVSEASNLFPLVSYASPHKITNLVVGSGDRAYATYDAGIMRFDSSGYLGDLDPGWSNAPTDIVVSADGNQLFSAVGPSYYNKTLRQFDISGAAPVVARTATLNLLDESYFDPVKLALSPDSQTLAASFGGSFEIISTEDFWDTREVYPTYGGPPSDGIFSGDGRWFYTTVSNQLSIFNAATGALDYSMSFGWGITSFALSGNGDHMFVGVNGEVRVFDTGRVNQAVPEPTSAALALAGAAALSGAARRRRA